MTDAIPHASKKGLGKKTNEEPAEEDEEEGEEETTQEEEHEEEREDEEKEEHVKGIAKNKTEPPRVNNAKDTRDKRCGEWQEGLGQRARKKIRRGRGPSASGSENGPESLETIAYGE